MISTNVQKWGGVVASLVSILALSIPAPARAIINGFDGDYKLDNWTLINSNTDGFVNPSSGSANSITLTGGNAYNALPNNSSHHNGITYFQTTIRAAGTVSFTYSYGTFDTEGLDPFMLIIDSTPASDGFNFSYGTNDSTPTIVSTPTMLTIASYVNQSGTYTTRIGKGDVFGFAIATNNEGGRANVTISDFSVTPATPVPFESNAAPAGMAIVLGAFFVRSKLRQSSAQKMLAESVDSGLI